jgi:CheY-like chemotaxis protein
MSLCHRERLVLLSSIRVLVVEDFGPFRRFIAAMLKERPDFQIVCEVSDGLEAVQKAEELQPDLIVLDIGLPTLNGIEAARRIRAIGLRSRILFFSENRSLDMAAEALGTGAQGYVTKSCAAAEFITAVEAVVQGRQFLSSGLGSPSAPITYTIDQESRLIRTRCVGSVTLSDVIHHFRELASDQVCPPRLDVFLDLVETTSLPQSDQFEAVHEEMEAIRARVRFGICAIVASGDLLFGMMKRFEGLAQQSFDKVRVFQAAAEAEKWLMLQRCLAQ